MAGSRLVLAVGILILAALPSRGLGAQNAPIFKAGAAIVDITPPVGLPMWGYGARKDAPASGVHDPLRASAVVIETADGKLALVGLDLGRSPARASMKKIRERVRRDADVETLFLIGSHTHHGPCIELEKVEPTSKYVDELVRKLGDVIVEAARVARPAKIGLASKELALNRNRHTKRKPKPVDRELAVMRIDGTDGAPIATVVNFAAHPTTHKALMLEWSADFPGPLRGHVEKTIGGVCVFLQGACGDLSTNRNGKSTEEYGVELGSEVVELSKSATPARPARPSIRSTTEEFTFSSRVDFKNPITYLAFCIAFFKDLVDAFRAEYSEGIRPNITVAVVNGDIGLVGASGEFFCTHAIRLKKRSPLPHTLFLGYCNGYHQYFPTREAVEEGGYGADRQVSPVEVGAGETLIERALHHLGELAKEIPKAK